MLEMISGILSRTVPDAVEARELLVFELKMRSLSSTHWPAVSGHSFFFGETLEIHSKGL